MSYFTLWPVKLPPFSWYCAGFSQDSSLFVNEPSDVNVRQRRRSGMMNSEWGISSGVSTRASPPSAWRASLPSTGRLTALQKQGFGVRHSILDILDVPNCLGKIEPIGSAPLWAATRFSYVFRYRFRCPCRCRYLWPEDPPAATLWIPMPSRRPVSGSFPIGRRADGRNSRRDSNGR